MMTVDVSRIGRVVAGTLVLGLVATFAALAADETIEITNGVILGVQGNVLTVRGPDGVKSYTVPDGFQFNMQGRMLSLSDLEPGMPIAAKITTTQTPVVMTATEVRNAKVIHSIGSAFVVRTEEGKTMKFTAKDIEQRNIVIYKDGKQISPYDLKDGDNVSATVVTELPPEIITETDVQAFVAMPPKPRPVRVAQAKRPAQPAASPTPRPKQLPKTGSRLPWVGLAGLVALAFGAGMTIRRVITG